MISKESLKFPSVMSNMISAWLAGYVGVMARRKIISEKKEYHRMYWEEFENITKEPNRIWPKMTCPQSWGRTSPSSPPHSPSFKMERKNTWGKGGFGWIYFLLLHHPSKEPWSQNILLLLDDRKTTSITDPKRTTLSSQGEQRRKT